MDNSDVIGPEILVALLIIVLCVSGCVSQTETTHNSNISIGLILPLTGSTADRGLDCLHGALLAVSDINNQGGILSKGKRPIELIIADSKGIPEVGANETHNLIENDSIIAIIGAYQSSVAIPATQFAEMHQIPFIVNVGISDVITERGFQYTFRIIPKVSTYAESKVKFLSYLSSQSEKPIKRVALLYENTAFGTASSLAERKQLKKEGFEIVSDISYRALNVSNLDDEVKQTLHSRPDAILITTYLTDSILIARLLHQTGFAGPVIDTAGGTISSDFIKNLGSEAEGIYSVSEFSADSPYGQELNQRFYDRFGMNISGDSAYTYQAVLVLKDALERAKTVSREDVREALAHTNISGKDNIFLPDKEISFDSEGQNQFSFLHIMQIKNGTWKTVWPDLFPRADQLTVSSD